MVGPAAVVVGDRAGSGGRAQRGAVGAGQGHGEGFVGLDRRVARDGDGEGLARLAGGEGHEAGCGGIIDAGCGRAVGRRVVHRHVLARCGAQRDREGHVGGAAVAFGQAGIGDRDGRGRVVVGDRHRGLLGAAFGGAAAACDVGDVEDDGFVVFVQRVLYRRDGRGPGGVAGCDGDGGRGQGVVGTAAGRRAGRREGDHGIDRGRRTERRSDGGRPGGFRDGGVVDGQRHGRGGGGDVHLGRRGHRVAGSVLADHVEVVGGAGLQARDGGTEVERSGAGRRRAAARRSRAAARLGSRHHLRRSRRGVTIGNDDVVDGAGLVEAGVGGEAGGGDAGGGRGGAVEGGGGGVTGANDEVRRPYATGDFSRKTENVRSTIVTDPVRTILDVGEDFRPRTRRWAIVAHVVETVGNATYRCSRKPVTTVRCQGQRYGG